MHRIDLLLVIAAVLVAVGAAMVFVPLGLVVAGFACAGAWWLLGEGGK